MDPAAAKTRRRSRAATAIDPLLDLLPAFVLIVQRDGAILACNRALSDAMGWPRGTPGAESLPALLPREISASLLAGNGASTVRAELQGANQTRHLIEWTARPHGDSGAVLLTGIDRSREHRLEEFIANNQWFETAAALSGGLAHDFNNVLAAILGLSEIISLRLPPADPLHSFTGKIAGSVDRAKELVRRFSQLSRKSGGEAEELPTAMTLTQMSPLLAAFFPGNVPFKTAISPETPWCTSDPHEFDHILLNCATYLRGRLRVSGGSVRLSSGASRDGCHALIELTGAGQDLVGLNTDRIFELDLRPTATAYDSGAALYTARLLAQRGNKRLSVRRADPRTIVFVLEVPVAP